MTIRKLPGQDKYRLYSAAGKNLGTFPTRAKAGKHERDVQYFKHAGEAVGWSAEIVYDGPADADFERKLLTAFGDHPSFLERYEIGKGFKGKPPTMRNVLVFDFTAEQDARDFARAAIAKKDGVTAVTYPKGRPAKMSKVKSTGSRVTAPRGAFPPSAPAIVEADEGSLEYFAATFLSSVQNGHMADWDTYMADPRTSQIAGAVRKLGLQRIQHILGGGSFGLAALDEDGHVLKLTSDETETQAGAVLRGKSLPHVVFIAGSWYVKDARVENEYIGAARIGILSMQAVEPLRNDNKADNLSAIVNAVKKDEGGYPADWEGMTPGKKRAHILHVSLTLEGHLRDAGRGFLGQLGTDVADALHELREKKVYAIDVHAGNVGWDASSQRYRVFDIGTSSSPKRPAPPVVHERGTRAPRVVYEVPAGVLVSEL